MSSKAWQEEVITSDKRGRVGVFCCSTLPERRRSSRRWRSVGMHSYCILGEWHTTEQLGKRQTQHHFSLIIACHIWYGTHCCRYVLSSALGFIPTAIAAAAAYVAGDLPYSATHGIHSAWVAWENMQLLRQSEKLWKQFWIYPFICWGTGLKREEPLADYFFL